ncbi:tyrosine-type recombinase/integrase [Alkalihalobacillus sp. 1P02AB]|uniref:tyrosine-type recombinase/integrase n=1 Tax=Alkalihalobacillus sp. 1P02AB TaxID=3132260 RepID=UPI0039A6BB06
MSVNVSLIQRGANPRIVQKRLGHEDIQTTFRYYGHLWVNADKEAIHSLEHEMEKHKKPAHPMNGM